METEKIEAEVLRLHRQCGVKATVYHTTFGDIYCLHLEKISNSIDIVDENGELVGKIINLVKDTYKTEVIDNKLN